MAYDTTRQQRPGSADPLPVVIDLASGAKMAVAIGGAFAVFGVILLYWVFTGQVTGGTGAVVVAGIISAVFVLLGLLPVLTWRTLSRRRQLILNHGGIRMDDPRGRAWAVAWDELAAVALSRTRQRRVKPADYITRRTMVRLDLFPAGPGFRPRHPEMEHLWEFHRVTNGYRLPFGHAPTYVPLIDEALRRFCPGIYQGIKDEGFTVGLF
jgi:hypothetical protein